MAKCGHDICPDDNCGLKYPLNGGRRARCRRIQGCIETSCSTLKATGPNGFTLYDACIGHCHFSEDDPKYPPNFQNVNDYLCRTFDPVSLVEYFGVNPCEVPVEQTAVGQVNAKEDAANQQTQTNLLVIAGIIVLLILLLFLD